MKYLKLIVYIELVVLSYLIGGWPVAKAFLFIALGAPLGALVGYLWIMHCYYIEPLAAIKLIPKKYKAWRESEKQL